MIALALALALSFAASLALESFPPSQTAARAPKKVLLRAAVHLGLFATAFALSWRPWHAAFVVVAVSFLFGLGSAVKHRILGEPLVFSDAALVRLAIRHPRLYYAERLAEPRALLGMASLVIATVVWFALEPTILPAGGLFLLILPPLVVIGLLWLATTSPVAAFARETVGPAPDAARDTDRFGLLATLALYGIGWRAQARPGEAARAAAAAVPNPAPARHGPKIVVAIQLESFVDLVDRGVPGPPCPNFSALRREASAWGRCGVPAEGAYTMRSEFGFLSGLPAATLGFDAYDPYLKVEAYAARALPRLIAASGRRTAMIHPYDRRFFERDRVMPALGFERFVDGSAFSTAERYGPYVSDDAVADALIAEINAAREPSFLFAVTIENHGPWGPGRLPETPDPEAQYALHLANADRMIGRVAAALAAVDGGGVLCLYGDHAPARGVLPDLPDRRATDYLLWDSRTRRRAEPTPRRDLAVDALGRLLLERI